MTVVAPAQLGRWLTLLTRPSLPLTASVPAAVLAMMCYYAPTGAAACHLGCSSCSYCWAVSTGRSLLAGLAADLQLVSVLMMAAGSTDVKVASSVYQPQATASLRLSCQPDEPACDAHHYYFLVGQAAGANWYHQ